MAFTAFDNYITDKNGHLSILNNEFKEFILVNGYYDEIILNEKYSFRIDLLASEMMGSSNYDFFILWINDINCLEDLRNNQKIKVPSYAGIYSYYSILKKEKLW